MPSEIMLKARRVARKRLGVKKPYKHQTQTWKAAIKHNKSVFSVMPTGSGKSIAFQVPCLVRKNLSIVVSPLLALMREQVGRLQGAGVRAFRIGMDMPKHEIKAALKAVASKEAKIIYVAPERLQNDDFLEALTTRKVGTIVVDEAHCFPAGTLIDTPLGPIPIEKVKAGCLVYAVDVTGKRVERRVTKTFNRTALLNGSFISGDGVVKCTRNHPVFVNGLGYIPTASVDDSDKLLFFGNGYAEEVPQLQRIIQNGPARGTVLLHGLPRRVKEEKNAGNTRRFLRRVWNAVRPKTSAWTFVGQKSGDRSPLLFSRVLEDIRFQGVSRGTNLCALLENLHRQGRIDASMLLQGVCVCSRGRLFVGTDDQTKSDEIAHRAEKGQRSYETEGRPVYAGNARGQRPGNTEAPKIGFEVVSGTETGVPYCHRKKERRPTLVYESRRRRAFSQACHRIGRAVTSAFSGTKARQKKGSTTCESGLEGSEIHEQRSLRTPRKSQEKDTDGVTVYNLEVEGENNYLANGILVHNCLSFWSRDFRPAYKNVGLVRIRFPEAIVIAATATADRFIEQDVVRTLKMYNYERIVGPPDRPNLVYEAVYDAEPNYIVHALRAARSMGGKGCGIVYCSSRKHVDNVVYNRLKYGTALRIGRYHAGMDATTRQATQDAFMNDEFDLMLATNAFGMGVDKSSVRLIYHYDYPESIFAYAQEAGRGGRDNDPALCILNIGKKGKQIREFLLRIANPKFYVYERLWKNFRRNKRLRAFIMPSDALDRIGRSSLSGTGLAALRFIEYKGGIRTRAGQLVYTLPILRGANEIEDICWEHRVKYAVDDDNNLIVTLPSDYNGRVIHALRRSRCVVINRPVEHLIVERLSDKLNVSPKEVEEKRDRADEQLDDLFRFAQATDKHAFLREAFLK